MNIDLNIDKTYLNFPIRHDEEKKYIKLKIDNKIFTEFFIPICGENPQYWVYLDFSEYIVENKKLSIEFEEEILNDIEKIEFADRIFDSENMYNEKYRPQIHFSSKRGWLNDPNGLVYHKGEYHLFYQHNPFDIVWKNMHWGHAISKDLVHWEEQPIALYPDKKGTMYSGSAIVDKKNLLGTDNGDADKIVLFYTAAGGENPISEGEEYHQCIAYKNEKDGKWEKYKNNPIIDNIESQNRDPKVFWHEKTKKWIMALYLHEDKYILLNSDNLINWIKTCDITLEGSIECPDLFKLPIRNEQGSNRWVFWGADGKYLIGKFDGEKFIPETETLFSNYGNAGYAAQTFNNIPKEDGRTIQISWSKTENLPDMPFNQFMTFPVELYLKRIEGNLKVFTAPIKEIELLYDTQINISDFDIIENTKELDIDSKILDITTQIDIAKTNIFKLFIDDAEISYDKKTNIFKVNDKSICIKCRDNKLKIRILVDTSSIEIFASDGLIYMINEFLFEGDSRKLTFEDLNGTTVIRKLQINTLKSIWQTNL